MPATRPLTDAQRRVQRFEATSTLIRREMGALKAVSQDITTDNAIADASGISCYKIRKLRQGMDAEVKLSELIGLLDLLGLEISKRGGAKQVE